MRRGKLQSGTGCFHQVTWRIPNFLLLSEEVNTNYTSPAFNFLNSRWLLRIYPNDNEEWIGIYLERRSQGTPQSVAGTFGIIRADGTERDLFHFKKKRIFSQENPVWGTSKFLKSSKVLTRSSELAPSGALTVVCTLWRYVEDQRLVSSETQTIDLADGATKEEVCARHNIKGGTILRKHFQDFLLNSSDYDVILKVKDQQFRAHKTILRARSPVFAAMFAHNMAENECGEVCIDDCDPDAFCVFLKHVYVGKFENISPATAAGLYYIADKYDFPDLKETCVEFLKASLTTNVVCYVVPLAMNHAEAELLESAMEFFSKHMKETLMTTEWKCFTTSNPMLANELIIEAMNRLSEDGPPSKKMKYS